VTRGRRLGLVLLLLGAVGGLGALLLAWGGDGSRVPPRWTWEQMMQDPPSLLLHFLAERAQDAHGRPDWRLLPEAGRHLWSTLVFEYLGPVPETPPVPGGLPAPTLDQVSEAYTSLGVPEAAGLVQNMRDAVAAGKDAASPFRQFKKLLPRIAAARSTYVEAHRAELDRISH
jgi:hypothetical protein